MEIAKNVQKFIDECDEIIANSHQIRRAQDLEEIESPIEQLFYCALQATATHNNIPFGAIYMPVIDMKRRKDTGNADVEHGAYLGIDINPQEELNKYRVDFLLIGYDGVKRTEVVIECDGHEFHDKNEKQRRYEKKRDRDLQADGFKVLRFTGSEIVNEPFRVALDALKFVFPLMSKVEVYKEP